MAHVEIARKWKAELEYLPIDVPSCRSRGRPLFFRVLSVGKVARHGITQELARFSRENQCVLPEWRRKCAAMARSVE